MIKGKEYHTHTESYAREKEAWFDDIPAHVAAFEAAGGKIYQATPGESGYAKQHALKPPAFQINPQKQSALRKSA